MLDILTYPNYIIKNNIKLTIPITGKIIRIKENYLLATTFISINNDNKNVISNNNLMGLMIN